MNKKDFIGKTLITQSFKETQKLGSDFAKALTEGDVVCLHGDLGLGKTTFVQGIAKGLGIENRVISPTFVMVRKYVLNKEQKAKNRRDFYHIDLYRAENERDIESLGLEEILNNKNNIVAIEWAEKLRSQKTKKRIDVEFFYEKENCRRITFGS